MIVSVQRDMSALKERLELSGYKVVFSDEYKHPVDAVIYSSRNETDSGFYPQPAYSSTLSNSFTGGDSFSFGTRYGGAIKINASGKTFEQIEEYLIRGRRSTLF